MWKPEPESLNEPLSAGLGMHAAQLKTKKTEDQFCMLQSSHQTREPHDSSGRRARSKVGKIYGSKDPAKVTESTVFYHGFG